MSGFRMFALGAALALIAAFAIAPHAAWTLSSTPVTVVNPSVPVTVGNPIDATVIAKAQGIQHPFTMGFFCTFSLDVCQNDPTNPPTVPATQRWVIESVGYSCGTDDRTLIFADISTTVAEQTVQFPLPVPPPNISSALQFVQTALNLRVYEDPGAQVFFKFVAPGLRSGGSCILTISGQAIDIS
jgi:hypothetical protein